MRKSTLALSVFLSAVLVAGLWLGSRAARPPAPAAGEKASAEQSAPVTVGALPEEKNAIPPSARAPSSVAPAANAVAAVTPTIGLENVFAKYSANQSWAIERDPNGKPMRMSGQNLKVMGGGPDTGAFLQELGRELGFKSQPVLERRATHSANFEVEDYLQSYRFASGETLPVYDAWLRLKGTRSDGAFVVVNLLKVVDESIRADLQLSGEDAIAILRREMDLSPDATLTVRPSTVVFADQAPHQRALQIDVGGPQPHWLVLVGFETHSVVYKRITSHN